MPVDAILSPDRPAWRCPQAQYVPLAPDRRPGLAGRVQAGSPALTEVGAWRPGADRRAHAEPGRPTPRNGPHVGTLRRLLHPRTTSAGSSPTPPNGARAGGPRDRDARPRAPPPWPRTPTSSCTGHPDPAPATRTGIFPDVYCAGNDATFDAARGRVRTKLLPLFPGPYLHVGGDECPKDPLEKSCPKCQARLRRRGLGR